jgi:gliding motility associated protien GldN
MVDTTELGIEQINAGEELSAEYINKRSITAADIREYHIKGLWYFDKRQAEMKYRLLGIAPVAPDVNFIDSDEPDLVPLFWVFFPDAREVLHEAKSFNNSNSSMPFSFDHLLNARRFQSYIFREENVQGDRAITEYVSQNALMQLLESERIKDKIRDFELDMWTY